MKAALLGALSFGASALLAYGIALAVFPPASAAPNAPQENNLQTTQLLAYDGGSLNGAQSPLLNMVVVSESAIQTDRGISSFNESGFVEDAPEINVRSAAPEAVGGPFTHVVVPGDTLSGIASQYGVSLNTVLWANGLTTASTLRAGNELTILPVDGVVHEVRSGDTLSGIAAKYETSSAEIAEFNNIDPGRLSIGDELVIPGGILKTAPAPRILAASPVQQGDKNIRAGQTIGGIQLPVTGIITQGFGNTSFARRSGFYRNDFHGGVDIGAPFGTPVYAAHDATVTFAGTKNGYGKVVYLKGKSSTGETVFTRYGHLQAYNVSLNQVVRAGEQIGEIGSTGRSTGPHLHFEIRNSRNEQYASHPFYQQNLNY